MSRNSILARSDVPVSIAQTLCSTDIEFVPKSPLLSSGGKATNLEEPGINPAQRVLYNAAVPLLYEEAMKREKGTIICDNGALAAFSGVKTGRSPKDKRVVEEPSTVDDIWWGPVNIKLPPKSFLLNRERAIDYLNLQDQLYVVDAYAGWDPKYRIKIRIVCSRAYHALFMWNMLVRPTPEELANFGEPDFTVYNAGCFPANKFAEGMSSSTSVSLDFSRKEMVILGTQYAGEMKKGVLTLMMYLMPKAGQLCLHSSANEEDKPNKADRNVTVFFGLSGTGKTTLSADPHRRLIGDDEHVWTDEGVFNVEGGCYAKCIGLSHEKEKEIYEAIRFGAMLENVGIDPNVRDVDYNDVSITENTRCSYPLQHIPNVSIPAVGKHPTNVILLTCDACGVLPPISKLTHNQCMYQFISGYTAKIPGTESGITTPSATFSACFGGPFLVWHPCKYAEMLKERLAQHGSSAWLINTGWVGGAFGSKKGQRVPLKYTRAMIDALHSGELQKVPTITMPGSGLLIPESCPGVPAEILTPWVSWESKTEYIAAYNNLADLFRKNFAKYADRASPEALSAEFKDWSE